MLLQKTYLLRYEALVKLSTTIPAPFALLPTSCLQGQEGVAWTSDGPSPGCCIRVEAGGAPIPLPQPRRL